jgi:hypothetical protein
MVAPGSVSVTMSSESSARMMTDSIMTGGVSAGGGVGFVRGDWWPPRGLCRSYSISGDIR